MKKNYSKGAVGNGGVCGNGGFTLVEMMIVIFIVGLLSTLSIGGYMQFRKASVLDLAAQNVVATLYDARDQAKWGKGAQGAVGVQGAPGAVDPAGGVGAAPNVEAVSKCFGVRFGGGASSISKIVANFDAKKTWNKIDGRWTDGKCGEVVDPTSSSVINLGDGLGVTSDASGVGDAGGVSDVGGVSAITCDLLFSPPNGDLIISQGCSVDNNILTFVIGYNGETDNDYKRKIVIDTKSEMAKVTKMDEGVLNVKLNTGIDKLNANPNLFKPQGTTLPNRNNAK